MVTKSTAYKLYTLYSWLLLMSRVLVMLKKNNLYFAFTRCSVPLRAKVGFQFPLLDRKTLCAFTQIPSIPSGLNKKGTLINMLKKSTENLFYVLFEAFKSLNHYIDTL